MGSEMCIRDRRYTPSGKILLSARQKDTLIEIAVWDTGIGIAPDDQESIFGEFHRLEAAQHIDQTGLGLGLSISQRMARMLDHSLKLASEPGKGSCFSLTLPQVLVDNKQSKAQTPINQSRHPLSGIKVLCIDNELDILDGMRSCLLYTSPSPRDLSTSRMPSSA